MSHSPRRTTSIAWNTPEAHGLSTADIRRLTKRGKMLRISPAQYGLRDEWCNLPADQQYVENIAHTWQRARTDVAVVSHLAAAALWGLPILHSAKRVVHLSGYQHPRGRSNKWATRHSIEVPAADREVCLDIPCTSLPRTVIDVARTESVETAIICADAAARQHVQSELSHQWPRTDLAFIADIGAATAAMNEFRARLHQQLESMSGSRGVRQARMITELATWQSDSPGESLSRLRMQQVGVPTPALQVRVPSPGMYPYRVDFGFPELEVFGEFDGATKYSKDPLLARDEVLAEKEREDWIRATTGWRFVRWRWKHIATQQAFATFACNYGLLTP